jgi:hypothetical protein
MNNTKITDYERFQLRVAAALARWQAVEITMREFFIRVIESPDWRWSAAAYHAVGAFRSQLEMLHEILLYRLPSEELIKEWKKLKQELVDQSQERNKVVHWTFIATYTETNKETYTYISAPFGDARKSRTGKQLTEADLDEIAEDFKILQDQLSTFHHKRVAPVLVSPEKLS